MKKLICIMFLMALVVSMSAQKRNTSYDAKKNRNAYSNTRGLNFSEAGKITTYYLASTASFVGTSVYATQTYGSTPRTSQQNAVLVAGTTAAVGTLVYGTYRLYKKNHR